MSYLKVIILYHPNNDSDASVVTMLPVGCKAAMAQDFCLPFYHPLRKIYSA